MFRIENGGAAFPRTGFYPNTSGGEYEHIRELLPTITEPQPGMTLFDYYVGQALAGLLANPGTFGRGLPPLDRAEAQALVAQLGGAAILYAQATLEAREVYLSLPQKPRAHNPEEEDG